MTGIFGDRQDGSGELSYDPRYDLKDGTGEQTPTAVYVNRQDGNGEVKVWPTSIVFDDFESGQVESWWNGATTGIDDPNVNDGVQPEAASPYAPDAGNYGLKLYSGALDSQGVLDKTYVKWGDAVEWHWYAGAMDDYMTFYLQFQDTNNCYYANAQVDPSQTYIKQFNGGTEDILYSNFNKAWAADTWYTNRFEFRDKTTNTVYWKSVRASDGTVHVDAERSGSLAASQYDGFRLAIDGSSTAYYDYLNVIPDGAYGNV